MTTARAPSPGVRGRVVVLGLLAAAPFGGMTWQVLHYLEALQRLGFDVWYVEDHESPMLHPVTFERSVDVAANVAYVRRQLDAIGLADRWTVRPSSRSSETFGALDGAALDRLFRDADAVLNLCGAHRLRCEHRANRCLIYVETDPVATQVAVAKGDPETIAALDAHDHHFTYGTALDREDSPVPLERYAWLPTRPPVVLDWWRTSAGPASGARVTTIANWNTSGKNVEWRGQTWSWNKRANFVRFIDAPARFRRDVEIAVVGAGDDHERLRRHGWRTISAWQLADPSAYRSYVRGSLAEFSVAKEQYVAPRSGWFSDRSVCYLAAGRPVIVQDTGFVRGEPVRGILPFRDGAELTERAADLAENYAVHAAAARDWAERCFDGEVVLSEMMRAVGLS